MLKVNQRFYHHLKEFNRLAYTNYQNIKPQSYQQNICNNQERFQSQKGNIIFCWKGGQEKNIQLNKR